MPLQPTRSGRVMARRCKRGRTVAVGRLAAVLVVAAVMCGGGAVAQTAPAPAAAAPAVLEQVAEDQVVSLLGLATRGSDGKEVGRIVDVLIDGAGKPRAVVIDVGGFLGMGNRKVAVDWAALRFSLGKVPLATLALASDRIESAPAYDPAKPVEAVGVEPPPVPSEPGPAAASGQ